LIDWLIDWLIDYCLTQASSISAVPNKTSRRWNKCNWDEHLGRRIDFRKKKEKRNGLEICLATVHKRPFIRNRSSLGDYVCMCPFSSCSNSLHPFRSGFTLQRWD
jgi:hypothetical protein